MRHKLRVKGNQEAKGKQVRKKGKLAITMDREWKKGDFIRNIKL